MKQGVVGCTLVAGAVALLSGCLKDGQTAAPVTTRIMGTVIDPTESPIPTAEVSIAGRDLRTTTDALGQFLLPVDNGLGDVISVHASATGYASMYRLVTLSVDADVQLELELRPVGRAGDVSLPGPGETATIALGGDDGGVELEIPHAALVDKAGNVASGDVQVLMTYWHPVTDYQHFPADLMAAEPDGSLSPLGPTFLESFGMTEIDVIQGGTTLQVASGATLGLTIKAPGPQRDGADPTNPPRLYWLNPATGFWQEEVDRYSYDAATGELVASLKHLSIYNSDVPLKAHSGCLGGRVVSQCGTPVTGAQVRVVLTKNGGRSWPLTTQLTGADGRFCQETGLSGGPEGDLSGHFEMTARAQKETYSGDTAGHVIVMSCSRCDGVCEDKKCACFNDPAMLDTPECRALLGLTGRPNVDRTGLCSQCVQIPDITLDAPCGGTPAGECTGLGPGDLCDEAVDTCCSTDGRDYICSDGLCVPTEE